jgi:sensor c-di-GMP phosphodiesterase-like protein
MLREADVAMDRAKRTGGRGRELFDETLREEVKEHLRIEGRLRQALPQHELVLAYQPILPLAGGRAVGCEALLRWNPKELEGSQTSPLLPGAFLPLAAETELIVQIGN